MTDRQRLAIVIPAYNEARGIRAVVEAVLQQHASVIVVDDGSGDDTVAQLDGLPVTLVRHRQRQGKGAALRSGFRAARDAGFTTVVTMDADGQHDPADLPRLLAASDAWPDHIVIGARLIGREAQPAARRRANAAADWGIGWACGQRMLDSQSGYRLYPPAALAVADRACEGFVFESDMLIEARRRANVAVVFVPIRACYGTHLRCSHFRPLADGVLVTAHITWKIMSRGFSPRAFRRSRNQPPLLFDPLGLLSSPRPGSGIPPLGRA